MAGSRNKESAEPRHCSGTPTKAQRNSARPAPFRVRPSTASSGYKSLAAQVRRFPEAELDSRLSLRIVTAATLSGHGLCSVRSPGLEFVGSATYRSSLASLSSESTVYQHRRPKSMTRRHLFCTRAHPAESFRTGRGMPSSAPICAWRKAEIRVLDRRQDCGQGGNQRQRAARRSGVPRCAWSHLGASRVVGFSEQSFCFHLALALPQP